MTRVLAEGRLLAAVVATVLLLAGCGGDDGGSTSASTQASGATQAADTTASSDSSAGGATTGDQDSGGGESAGGGDFCEQLMQVGDDIEASVGGADPANAAQAFQQAADAMESIEAPSEIEGAWGTLTTVFTDFAEAFKGIDFEDPQSVAGAQDELAKLQERQAELTQAANEISAYAAKECGIEDLSQTG